MPSSPLRFAVVGCGALARQQHIPNITQHPDAVLQACVDLDDAALDECRDRFGARRVSKDYRETLAAPDIDAVVLATTERLRLPVIAQAAALGKPVYVEKPLATTLHEVYRIREAVKAAGIPFCVGHNRRASPAMRFAQQLFRRHMDNPAPNPWRWDREGPARPALAGDGVAGLSARINDDWYSWKAWVHDPSQAPHGPMLFEMTHFTDVCNWFLQAEPESVVALDHGVFNHGVVIRYRTGELATIMMCANGSFAYPKELYETMGNGAVVVVDHMLEVRSAGIPDAPPRQTFDMLHDRHPEVGTEGGLTGWLAKRQAACAEAAANGDPMQQFTAEPDKGHARALGMFVDQILCRGPEVAGIDDAVRATEVAFAAVWAAKHERAVTIDEIRELGFSGQL